MSPLSRIAGRLPVACEGTLSTAVCLYVATVTMMGEQPVAVRENTGRRHRGAAATSARSWPKLDAVCCMMFYAGYIDINHTICNICAAVHPHPHHSVCGSCAKSCFNQARLQAAQRQARLSAHKQELSSSLLRSHACTICVRIEEHFQCICMLEPGLRCP